MYNNLQIRKKVSISADVTYLLSKDDIERMSVPEIASAIKNEFSFDNFKWQQENNVLITEKFRADYLHKVLYKCPHCLKEGMMNSKGTQITCNNCGNTYELAENGYLRNDK